MADSIARDYYEAGDGIIGMGSWDRFAVQNIGGRGGVHYADWVTPTATENGRILVCHSGHEPPWYATEVRVGERNVMLDMVNAALAAGYCILGVAMPVMYPNPNPETLTVAETPTSFGAHTYSALDADGGTAANCRFIEPVVVAINQALAERPGYDVCMMGHSGGGWTTEYVGAVDTRILYSASVFGSVPWSTYTGEDYEQSINNAMQTHGGAPIDRHVMRGQSRRAVSIHTALDFWFPVSTQGERADMEEFARNAQARISAFGTGEYAAWDDTGATSHDTWSGSITFILADINSYFARRNA